MKRLLIILTLSFSFGFTISHANVDTEPRSITLLKQNLGTSKSSNLQLSYSSNGILKSLVADPDSPLSQPYNQQFSAVPEQSARNFLVEYGDFFGLESKSENLALLRQKSLDNGHAMVQFQQQIESTPVFAGEMILQLDKQSRVTLVRSELATASSFDPTPHITASQAQAAALSVVDKYYALGASKAIVSIPELWVFNPSLIDAGPAHNSLVWRIEITGKSATQYVRELVMVDAHRGHIAWHLNLIAHAKNRLTYDNNNTISTLPGGNLVRAEGAPNTGITEVDNAHNYAGDTYDFYAAQHGRDSLDNAGLTIISTVRHCDPLFPCPLANAFWTGTQMAYGDGFAAADDVVAHELTHGVTTFESNLVYANQSGAINESFSDIWGEFVDLGNGAGTDTPAMRWQLGEDVPGVGAIRNMANPPDFGDPDRVLSPLYACGVVDNGGVHSNSGIGNKTAYLLVDGETFNGVTVTGIGLDKTATLFYEAQTNLLTSGSGYADLASALTTACTTLTGTNGITAADCSQVSNAIAAVEMVEPVCFVPPVALCSGVGDVASNIFFDGFETSTLNNWTSNNLIGSNNWTVLGSNPGTDSFAAHVDNPSIVSDSVLSMDTAVTLPAAAYLHFQHQPLMETGFDGGVLEYTLDDISWVDAGPLFTNNGYDTILSSSLSNPLGGRNAFSNGRMSYVDSKLDLSPLAGSSVRFRYRVGTDSSVSAPGWDIDNVRMYTCGLPGANQPPIANAGPDQLVSPSSTVNLNGGSSVDPENSPLTYAWIETSTTGVVIINANTVTPSFVAPATSTSVRLQLTVTDNQAVTSTDQVIITVNVLPTAIAGVDQSVITATRVNLDGSGSVDPDGNGLNYLWGQTSGPTVILSNVNSPTPYFFSPKTSSTLTLSLTVSDSRGQTSTDSVTIAAAPHDPNQNHGSGSFGLPLLFALFLTGFGRVVIRRFR